MAKVKTRKSVAKRFRVTRKGKVMRGKSFKSHLRVKKSAKQRRRLGKTVELRPVYAKKIKKVLGTRVKKPQYSRPLKKVEAK